MFPFPLRKRSQFAPDHSRDAYSPDVVEPSRSPERDLIDGWQATLSRRPGSKFSDTREMPY